MVHHTSNSAYAKKFRMLERFNIMKLQIIFIGTVGVFQTPLSAVHCKILDSLTTLQTGFINIISLTTQTDFIALHI